MDMGIFSNHGGDDPLLPAVQHGSGYVFSDILVESLAGHGAAPAQHGSGYVFTNVMVESLTGHDPAAPNGLAATPDATHFGPGDPLHDAFVADGTSNTLFVG